VTYESAVYYMKWVDIQQDLEVLINHTPTTALVNDSSASGPGFEVGLQIRPIRGLSLDADLTWNDLTFDSPVVQASSTGIELVIPKGGRPGNSPEYTAGLLGRYEFGIGIGDWKSAFTASINYTSTLVAYDIGMPTYSNSTVLTRASIDLLAPSHWTFSAFVDNAANANPVITPPTPGVETWNDRMVPRTAGLQVEYRMR
jgi:hypothetical protein